MQQIKEPGFFTRGKASLAANPNITPDSLLAELNASWGPRGFTAYKTALIGADIVLKKSGWTGLAIKIKHSPKGTEILFNPFAPSVFVRLLAMGMIPILIVYFNAWKPLSRQFCDYLQSAPYFQGQLTGPGAPGQLGPGQQPMAQLPQQTGAGVPQGYGH